MSYVVAKGAKKPPQDTPEMRSLSKEPSCGNKEINGHGLQYKKNDSLNVFSFPETAKILAFFSFQYSQIFFFPCLHNGKKDPKKASLRIDLSQTQEKTRK